MGARAPPLRWPLEEALVAQMLGVLPVVNRQPIQGLTWLQKATSSNVTHLKSSTRPMTDGHGGHKGLAAMVQLGTL